jgi:hypothetical protein
MGESMRIIKIHPREARAEISEKLTYLKSSLMQEAREAEEKLESADSRISRYIRDNEKKKEQISVKLNHDLVVRREAENALAEIKTELLESRKKFSDVSGVLDRHRGKLTCTRAKKAQRDNILKGDFISDELLNNMAVGLSKISHQLSSTHPVEISKSWMSFVTSDIYIRDIDGSPIDHSFGQFTVNLRTSYNTLGGRDLSLEVLPQYGNEKRGYTYHPHISETNRPCMGRIFVDGIETEVERYLKTVLVPEYRIVEVIQLFWEFFTKYTKGDAYTNLSNWIGDNGWDWPSKVCDKCSRIYLGGGASSYGVIVPICSCLRDRMGMHVRSEAELAPCGFKWSHCLTKCTSENKICRPSPRRR